MKIQLPPAVAAWLRPAVQFVMAEILAHPATYAAPAPEAAPEPAPAKPSPPQSPPIPPPRAGEAHSARGPLGETKMPTVTPTTTSTPTPSAIMTSTGVESLFGKLAAAAETLPAEALSLFSSLLGDAKTQLQSTIAVLAPGLDDAVSALDVGLTAAADAFVIAHTGPLVAGEVDPEIKVFVDSTAATAKAQIDAWAAKYVAAAPASGVAS